MNTKFWCRVCSQLHNEQVSLKSGNILIMLNTVILNTSKNYQLRFTKSTKNKAAHLFAIFAEFATSNIS